MTDSKGYLLKGAGVLLIVLGLIVWCNVQRFIAGDATETSSALSTFVVEGIGSLFMVGGWILIRRNDSIISDYGDEAVPLTITVSTHSRTIRYWEKTADATLGALRTDILQGTLSRDAKTSVETKMASGKSAKWDGPLLRCALRFPARLANLYLPLRQHAVSGLVFGILIGILLCLSYLGFVVYQSNSIFGTAILGLAALTAAAAILTAMNRSIGLIWYAFFILCAYLVLNGLFAMVLGSAFIGALLGSMPGMTVGAIIGTLRRPKLPRAYDAPNENAFIHIAIPLILSILIWSAFSIWARPYLTSYHPFASRDATATKGSTAPTSSASPIQSSDTLAAINRIKNGRHETMPAPTAVTANTLYVYFSGPTTRTVTIPTGSKAGVTLDVGSYQVAAEIPNSDIRPFYGAQSYASNTHYWIKFYVQ